MAQFSPPTRSPHAATIAASGAINRLPAAIGRFELKRVLGKGAQSVVWLAYDPRLERDVALKVMRVDGDASDATVSNWLREARSVSRLSHPNIVPVFEADVEEHQPYLVFELVSGETLAQRLRLQGAFTPMEAASIMMDVLEALSASHAAGIVHRDLKPSNVLLDKAGRARVTDFGIAASVPQQDADSTGLLSYVGTPGYLSPEAVKGRAPTPAMDIFSAGLLFAGERPAIPPSRVTFQA